jgi:hypothetical protein
VAQVDEIVAGADWILSADELAAINAAYQAVFETA